MSDDLPGDLIVGIDLGTTNSEIAAFHGGRVRILGPAGKSVLPSCVGISPAGQLLVGEAARNQSRVFPERTIRSVKRRMGSSERLQLGEKSYLPEEVSALILGELVRWGERELGRPLRRAVITVPAYFSDAQRSATRLAGEIAGLDVVRILNEPTAASLAYGASGSRRTVLVYDLGGGTFDVSLVSAEGDVTEVLASHGNTRLGGDDIDDLLARRLAATFKASTGVDAAHSAAATARLWWAAEEAKKQLSFEPAVTIREEALMVHEGRTLNFEHELTREELEELVRPLLGATLDSVHKALKDADKRPEDVDEVLLVGGATRMPMISRMLEEIFHRTPSQAVHPDLCVALGAGVLASRIAGQSVDRVLVDVSPYSFGPSYLGERDGGGYPYCYHPVIKRNTPLPVTRTERYFTSHPGQTQVKVSIFQGDEPDALDNILVGEFMIDQLTPTEEPNEVDCRMAVDLDGILRVTAVEKRTGRSAHIEIENAFAARSAAEVAASRARLAELAADRPDGDAFAEAGEYDAGEDEAGEIEEPGPDEAGEIDEDAPEPAAGAPEPAAGAPHSPSTAAGAKAGALLARSRQLLESMTPDDREEAVELHDRVAGALASGDAAELARAVAELEELLFFVDGRS